MTEVGHLSLRNVIRLLHGMKLFLYVSVNNVNVTGWEAHKYLTIYGGRDDGGGGDQISQAYASLENTHVKK